MLSSKQLTIGTVGRSKIWWVAAAGVLLSVTACEKKKEKVLDIETPGVDIEIHKTDDGFEVKGERKHDPEPERDD